MKYYGGIDLGGTNTKIGLLDESGNLIFKTTIKTMSELGSDETVKRICDVLKNEMANYGISQDDLHAVGLGIPGPVVNKRMIKFFSNLPWGENLDLASVFERHLDKKTFLDNDVNVITLGEAWVGAAKNYSNIVGIAIGTGIGGAVVVDGKIVSGKLGAAGEIGHIKLFPNGILCGCGQKGCFEAYASATGIVREAESRLKVNKKNSLYEITLTREIEAKDIFDAAKNGDEFALDIVNCEADYLALGFANVLNVLDPEVIVIGGGVSLAGDILFKRLKEKLKLYALPPVLENLEIKQSILGNDAGIYGAGYLAMLEMKN